MKLCTAGLAVTLLTCSWCSALPPKQDHNRVHEMKLSEKDHEVEGDHNEDYDHDAFLGQDDAKSFDELSPEESKEKLAAIVDKIDKNNDGKVTEEELQQWIQYVQKKYVNEDTDRNWKDHDLDSDNALNWESYRKRTYGYEHDPEEEEDYSDMVKRDERKFKAADEDKDGKLSKKEFTAFLHPEEHDHMKDIVVLETIEDIDKNKDGFISLEEYIADLEDGEDDDDDDDDGDNMIDWKASETEQFHSFRDRNRDGKLDKEEVKHWIIPDDYDSSESEAQHLVKTSDTDKDGVLTKEEILDNYDVFVGSQATDFGEALTRHDEF